MQWHQCLPDCRTAPTARCAIRDRRDRDENRASALRNESADNTDSADPAEPMEANDPTLPMERIEPVLPIDRMDPRDPIERIEPFERSDSIERVAIPVPFARNPWLTLWPRWYAVARTSVGRS